jgi:hypothetical protein
MREIGFDIEKSLFLNSANLTNDNHVFVAGLARSGSTALLRAIHSSEEFASLSYVDMPFVLSPNLWGKLKPKANYSKLQERAHGDNIMVSTNSPEAFEEVFWKTFSEKDSIDEFKNYIHLILQKYQKKRYLSKNNQNVVRLAEINKLLPHSKILIPFREPLQHANSLLSQHLRFSNMQKEDNFVKDYMDWIGHREFGLSYRPSIINKISHNQPSDLNHWLEQWYLIYSNLFGNYSEQKNFIFICYESLCLKDNYWAKIRNLIEVKKKYSFNFVESKKEINHEFDQRLYSKCIEKYDEIKSLTIP